MEVCIGFLKESGAKLTEVSPRGVHAIFEQLRRVLHEGTLEQRTQYMVEVMFAIRKDGFKDHPSIIDGLDLVDEEEQITHMITLDDAVASEDILSKCTAIQKDRNMVYSYLDFFQHSSQIFYSSCIYNQIDLVLIRSN